MSNELTTLTEAQIIEVLRGSLYPGASVASVQMVVEYCKAARLDVMQKPVHIVPMWDSKAGQMRDVVMPGVGLYRTQASRAGCSGISDPEFGPDVTETIGGQEITYPQWCRVTVQKTVNGLPAPFTAKEFWKENYAVKGGKEKSIAPNAMWTKRPYGQIAKCAEAQALRKAFPELGSAPTAEEMQGKAFDDDAPIVSAPAVDQMLLDSAIKAAKQGREAYAKFWKDAEPSQRAALRPYVSTHQAEVIKAEENTIEAMPAATVEADPMDWKAE